MPVIQNQTPLDILQFLSKTDCFEYFAWGGVEHTFSHYITHVFVLCFATRNQRYFRLFDTWIFWKKETAPENRPVAFLFGRAQTMRLKVSTLICGWIQPRHYPFGMFDGSSKYRTHFIGSLSNLWKYRWCAHKNWETHKFLLNCVINILT